MKKIVLLIIIAIALGIALLAFAIGFIFKAHFLGGLLDKATGQPASNVGDACITPLWPNVTDNAKFADAINQYIQKNAPNSPFVGLGADFVSAGQANGVNPAYEINIARKESSFGIARSTAVTKGNNAFGRTATVSQPGVSGGGHTWYVFSSFQASIADEAAFLQRVYISKGFTTIDAITNKYAPPSENNTGQYITEMKGWVSQAMTIASSNGAVTCTGQATSGSSSSSPIDPSALPL